jgi:hypothetical protein
MDENLLYSIVVGLGVSSLLLYYHFKLDPWKDMERHLFRNHKPKYYLFKVTYFVLLTSAIFSLKYILYAVVFGKKTE